MKRGGTDEEILFLKVVLSASALIIIIPLLILPLWSFANRWVWPDLLPQGFSLRAIRLVAGENLVWLILSSTLLSFLVAILSTAIGAMSAFALSDIKSTGNNIIMSSTLLPLIIPATAFTMGIHVVLLQIGLANNLGGVVLIHSLYAIPYTCGIMYDLVKQMGTQMQHQGAVLGATPVAVFKEITIPLIMPGITVCMCIAFVISFSQYFTTLLIGGGRVKTLMLVMLPYIQNADRSVASAYALLFLIISIIVFVLIRAIAKTLCKLVQA